MLLTPGLRGHATSGRRTSPDPPRHRIGVDRGLYSRNVRLDGSAEKIAQDSWRASFVESVLRACVRDRNARGRLLLRSVPRLKQGCSALGTSRVPSSDPRHDACACEAISWCSVPWGPRDRRPCARALAAFSRREMPRHFAPRFTDLLEINELGRLTISFPRTARAVRGTLRQQPTAR